MYIEKINDNKIKVLISKEDIKIWNVTIKNLTDNTPEAQDLFWFALRQAEKDVDFQVGKSQLLVEALPSKTDGFIMMISKVDPDTNVMDIIESNNALRGHNMEIKIKRHSRVAEIINIFKFKTFENLCDCIGQLENMFLGKSVLYKYKDEFYLCLSPHNTMSFFEGENLLSEYAERVASPSLFVGVLEEHGVKMIGENAFEIIKSYFG